MIVNRQEKTTSILSVLWTSRLLLGELAVAWEEKSEKDHERKLPLYEELVAEVREIRLVTGVV